MAYTLTKNIDTRGRDNSAGGIGVYMTETANITNITYSVDGSYISGITMSGTTKFYRFDMNRESINFTNSVELNVPFGIFIMKPLVNFNLPGLSADALNMFDTLVRKTVTVIIKTRENKYFLVGQNGLDLTSNSKFMLGQAAADQIGSAIELDGLESVRIFQLDPTTAASIMTGIVSTT